MSDITRIPSFSIDATVLLSDSGSLAHVECHYSADTTTDPTQIGTTAHLGNIIRGDFSLERTDAPDLWSRLEAFTPILEGHLPEQSVEFGGERLVFRGKLTRYRFLDNGLEASVRIRNVIEGRNNLLASLTENQSQLFTSIQASLERLAWEDLKTSFGGGVTIRKQRVFVSYRKGHEKIAEAIARRLVQEGLDPWLDKWETVAGDSLVGKIEEAFESSSIFVPIISADYHEGNWATQEMETAIAKRVNHGYRIVPIKFDPDASIPDLLQPLIYADFTDHAEEVFESQARDLIDGIFGIPKNPYR